MLSTPREQVKTQGNKDERGETHALGSSGEVGLRAERCLAGTKAFENGKVERGKCK